MAADLRAQTRAVAREFFALPAEEKARYAIAVGVRTSYPPVISHEYLRDKLDAITVT